MPVVNSGKVLVTGANGFVAMWIIDSLLKQGYAVRAVVRSADKGAHITQVFAEYEARLEIATVEDMTAVCSWLTRRNFLPIAYFVTIIERCF